MSRDQQLECLTAGDWEDYLQPLATDNSRWQAHLDQCHSCRETLDALAGDTTWWAEAHELLSSDDDRAVTRITESVCALSLESAPGSRHDPLCKFEVQQLQNLIEPASHPELLGRIGRYELEQLVGRGGMGLVFRARDVELHRVVAVKTLAIHLIPIGSAREQFIREARASAALVHPHIVPVHDVITDGPIPALVMQYVAGPTLEGWLAARGPMPWQQVLQIAIQLVDALSAAHAHGLVHRDIKPGNVLLEADGSRALLSDFGLVRALDEATLTHSGMLAGTPDYMSPEQARGESVVQSSDLFSLGSMLYAMLSGHPPFRANDPMAVLNRICHERHRSLATDHPEIPVEICRMVDKLLSKVPKHRYCSADELRDHLQKLAQAQLHLRRKWTRPHTAIVLVMVATALVALAFVVLQPDQQESLSIDTGKNQSDARNAANGASANSYSSTFSAAHGFAELRALDRRLQQLDQQTLQLQSENRRPTPAQVLSDPPPSIEVDRRLRHIWSDLSNLEQEVRGP